MSLEGSEEESRIASVAAGEVDPRVQIAMEIAAVITDANEAMFFRPLTDDEWTARQDAEIQHFLPRQ